MNGFANNAPPSFADTAADLLASGCRLRFRATGRSMQPAIGEGEMITVEPVSVEDVRSGDIVFYRTQKCVIAHRVEKIKRDSGRVTVLVLRGDTCEHLDAPVLPSQVLGRVVAVDRGGRQIDLVGKMTLLRQRFRTLLHKIRRMLYRHLVRAVG
jgi:signal peptidase I